MPCILAGHWPRVKTGAARRSGRRASRISPYHAGWLTSLALFVADGCQPPRFVLTLGRRGSLTLRGIGRKIAAVAALLAMLLPGLSTLAETLSAANLPACCNTTYCPVHHRQSRDLQKDKSNCDSMGIPGQRDCSMRACDAPQAPAVGTPSFVLVAPVALSIPNAAEAAPVTAALFSPFVPAVPLTPPPRALTN
jgi:hypothetical protein